ncbi:lipoate--protein ligase family protein [Pseudomonas sp. UL073]|uniref:Lipoate--protein ligase family protein n=1 Tax=Zestomonas insulae TaxID=2809017 RepID=A0ABS2IAS9_9GAMM|nr:lipoate--protein ligase family protein [Pseudomonas insulae]MBM7060115.1 lipoate--protein ligase family protein [Pseudomonas insulae]
MQAIREFPVEAGLDAERLLLDQAHAAQHDCALLLWRPTEQALVMPRKFSRLPGFAEAAAQCAERGWPVALRDTGGEPVPQSPAVLNVALVYAVPPHEPDLTRLETAYLRLCQPFCAWLAAQGLQPGLGAVEGAFCDGRYNITLEGRKLVGTAQRWRRRPSDGRYVTLAHGAALMGNQREAMVELVNAFYAGCGLDERCRSASHIGLAECLEEPWVAVDELPTLYRQTLAEVGLALPLP